MSCVSESVRCNIFGDSFIEQLGALLKNSLGIEIKHEVTLSGGTINGLRRKLVRFYKKKKRRNAEREECCVIMIGTYNIMDCGKENVWKFSRTLRKELSQLITLLERHHKYIILLTALPLLKMDGKKHYWQLLRIYNRHIKSFSINPKMIVVDLFPIFTQKRISLTCNENYYDKPKIGFERTQNQVWNHQGMERATRKILDAVVNIKKLQSHNNIGNLVKEEKSSNKLNIMGTRLGDFDFGDENPSCRSVNNFSQSFGGESSRNVDRSDDVQDTQYSSTLMEMQETKSSIYDSQTVCLSEGLKQKLSCFRVQEYSKYGKELLNQNKIKSIENELITVATYNVLSQDLLEKHKYIYVNHDETCLNWNVRREILNEEFSLLNADILCLQEIDFSLLDPIYTEGLNAKGYEGVHKKKTHGKTDGCAIYYKTSKFNLVESVKVELYRNSVKLLDRDNIGVLVKLSLKAHPENEFVVATTHLLYNPRRADLKLVQTQIMLAEIERFAFSGLNHVTGESNYLPIIFAGDMNYYPGSAGYELVTKSFFEYEGKPNRFLMPFTEGRLLDKTLLPSRLGITDSCQYLSSLCNRLGSKSMMFETGTLEHPLYLTSVYDHMKNNYPEATTTQDRWVTADYIFYSQKFDLSRHCRVDGNLRLVSKLTLPNTKEAETDLVHIPNLACGSDHLPLLATFHITGSN